VPVSNVVFDRGSLGLYIDTAALSRLHIDQNEDEFG